MLEEARPHFASDPDLSRVVLNATSWVEANLAVELLEESVPCRALVTAANIRETIKELPRCPMPMRVDFESLAKIWDMGREGMGWTKSFEDPAGDYSIVLLGDGNWCYDIVVRADGRSLMWMPGNSEEDFLNPDVIDLIMARPTVLRNVIDLVQAMGLSFYPKFYFSLEDWRQEYMQTVVEEVVRTFSLDEFMGTGPASAPARSKAAGKGTDGSQDKLTWRV